MRPIPAEILLVEDNPGDVRLTMEALKESKIINNPSIVTDGEEAIAFLRGEGRYANAPHPHMVLLDLNLPKKDGREVLDEIKNDPALRTIPIIVLTTSRAEQDIVRSYNLGANCYVIKPIDLAQFVEVVQAIEQFWFSIVALPPGPPAGLR